MARSFNGSSDYARNANGIVTAAPLTFSCWGYWASATVTQNTMMGLYNSAGTQARNLFSIVTTPTAATTASIGANTADGTSLSASTFSATSVAINTWYHFGAVFASSTSRTMYFRGSAATTNTTSRTPSGIDRFSIGREDNAAANRYLNGGLAEVGVWSAALSSDDIASLAKGVSPLLVRPESLVAYWPLGGNYSPEIDPVGKFDLTLTGTAKADHPRILMPRGRQIFLPAASAPPTGNRRRRILLGAA